MIINELVALKQIAFANGLDYDDEVEGSHDYAAISENGITKTGDEVDNNHSQFILREFWF